MELVDVIEVVEKVLEVGEAVGDDRPLDTFEDRAVDALGVVDRFQDERRDRSEQDRLWDPC